MSSVIAVPRLRWAARKMIVRRWLVHPDGTPFKRGDPICEVEIDGRISNHSRPGRSAGSLLRVFSLGR